MGVQADTPRSPWLLLVSRLQEQWPEVDGGNRHASQSPPRVSPPASAMPVGLARPDREKAIIVQAPLDESGALADAAAHGRADLLDGARTRAHRMPDMSGDVSGGGC